MPTTRILLSAVLILLIGGCSTAYYNTLEKVGLHKRDILVDRVEAAADAQGEAQEQFKSALDQFASVVELKDTDLKQAYERLNDEFEDSEAAADHVSDRIEKVESVAEALFDEWEDELALYSNAKLKADSQRKLRDTRRRYDSMLKSMRRAEGSMRPVLDSFRDHVLYLKHNLNAQAIGSLRGEFGDLKYDIARLIERMNQSISESNRFIDSLRES